MEKSDICVLIVTYGRRLELIGKVIHSLVIDDVKSIIIISNGQDIETRDSLSKICIDARIKIIWNDENLGSAGGYSQGLDYFVRSMKEKFILLLDDDNVLSSNGLSRIVEQYKENNNEKIIICAKRNDRNAQLKAIQKNENIIYYNNSFLGYNVLSLFMKKSSDNDKYIYSDIVPYGGMVLDRTIIEHVGLPDKGFFLYSDDYEYSLRIREKGYFLTILKDVSITDIDTSWHVSHKGAAIIDPESSKMRVYYTVRNGVITDIRYKKKSYLFYVNMCFFILIQIAKDIRARKMNFIYPRNWSLFYKAYTDAKNNKLGKVDFL